MSTQSTASVYTHRATTSKLYGPGQEVTQAQAGDFLLTHSRSWTGWFIRFGQSFRYFGTDAKYAHWNHAALFVDAKGNIVEALGGGVQLRNISVYKDTEYHVVFLQAVSTDDRNQEVAFASHCLNDSYGFMTILSLALSLLTGAKFGFGIDGQMICSGLVARSLERTGEIFDQDSWHATPADLAKHFQVIPMLPTQKGQVPPEKLGVMARSK